MKFFVPGVPVPKGSAKAFVHKQTGRAVVRQDNSERQKPWASMISYVAARNKNGAPPSAGPMFLSCTFHMPRPKTHYYTGKRSGVLRPNAPLWHTSRTGDLDKLVRCLKDALTGIIWVDDCQVAKMGEVVKVYGEIPGVCVEVREI